MPNTSSFHLSSTPAQLESIAGVELRWKLDDAKHVQFPPQFDTGDAFKLRRAPFEETLFVADLAPINVANPKKTRCDVPDDRGYQRCYLTSGSQHFMWTGDFEKYSTIDSMPP